MSICVVAGVVTSRCSEWIVAFLTGLFYARGLKSNSRQDEIRSILLSPPRTLFFFSGPEAAAQRPVKAASLETRTDNSTCQTYITSHRFNTDLWKLEVQSAVENVTQYKFETRELWLCSSFAYFYFCSTTLQKETFFLQHNKLINQTTLVIGYFAECDFWKECENVRV